MIGRGAGRSTAKGDSNCGHGHENSNFKGESAHMIHPAAKLFGRCAEKPSRKKRTDEESLFYMFKPKERQKSQEKSESSD